MDPEPENKDRLTDCRVTSTLVSFGPKVSMPLLMALSRNRLTASTAKTRTTTNAITVRIMIFFISIQFLFLDSITHAQPQSTLISLNP